MAVDQPSISRAADRSPPSGSRIQRSHGRSDSSRLVASAQKAADASRLNRDQLAHLAKRIYVSEDKTSAWIVLAPGATFPRRLLEVVLEYAGISYGIQQSALGQASRGAAEPRRLIVARGDAASPGMQGRDVYGQVTEVAGVELTILISEDRLEARALHRPGQILHRKLVERVVKQSGLRFGIIREALEQLWDGPADPSGSVLIARGRSPVMPEPGGFVLQQSFLKQVREVSSGEVIAEWQPPVKGASGMNVLGQAIRIEEVAPRLPDRCLGEGVALSRAASGQVIARSNQRGYPRQRPEGVVAVWTAVEVSGDLGPQHDRMCTDHLVVVRGDVLPGAKIESSADVVIMGDLRDAEIAAGGTIEVHGNVSAGEAELTAGEGVVIEGSCDRSVIAGSLSIQGEMRNCSVRVTGDVTVDAIVGGSVICGGNLMCRQAGDDRGVATEIWAGHQPSLDEQQRILKLAERRMAVEREALLERTSAERVDCRQSNNASLFSVVLHILMMMQPVK